MQNLTKNHLFHRFLRALLVSGCIYFLILLVWQLSSQLRGNDYAVPSILLLFVLASGFVGYVLLRRKIAIVAAGSAAIVLLGVYNVLSALAESLLMHYVLVAMGIIGGAGMIYGMYRTLALTRWPWLVAIVMVVISIGVGAVASLTATYIVRTSFTL